MLVFLLLRLLPLGSRKRLQKIGCNLSWPGRPCKYSSTMLAGVYANPVWGHRFSPSSNSDCGELPLNIAFLRGPYWWSHPWGWFPEFHFAKFDGRSTVAEAKTHTKAHTAHTGLNARGTHRTFAGNFALRIYYVFQPLAKVSFSLFQATSHPMATSCSLIEIDSKVLLVEVLVYQQRKKCRANHKRVA